MIVLNLEEGHKNRYEFWASFRIKFEIEFDWKFFSAIQSWGNLKDREMCRLLVWQDRFIFTQNYFRRFDLIWFSVSAKCFEYMCSIAKRGSVAKILWVLYYERFSKCFKYVLRITKCNDRTEDFYLLVNNSDCRIFAVLPNVQIHEQYCQI